MALSFCLFILIMLIIRSLTLFVGHQRVLAGQWPDWPHSAIVLAAVSGRSAAGLPGPRVPQTFSPPFENLFPCHF